MALLFCIRLCPVTIVALITQQCCNCTFDVFSVPHVSQAVLQAVQVTLFNFCPSLDRDRSQVSQYEICSVQIGTGTGFSPNSLVFSPSVLFHSHPSAVLSRRTGERNLGTFCKQRTCGNLGALDRGYFHFCPRKVIFPPFIHFFRIVVP